MCRNTGTRKCLNIFERLVGGAMEFSDLKMERGYVDPSTNPTLYTKDEVQ